MKKLILAILFPCLTLLGANPSFDSFDTNYFRLVYGAHGPTSIQLQTNLFNDGTNTYIFYSITNIYLVSSNIDAGNIQGTANRLAKFSANGSSMSNSIAYETNGALVVEGSDLGGGAGIYTPGWYSSTNRLNGIVNVLSFGADPTGASDSATAIQAGLDHGGTLLFPPGTYTINSGLILSNLVGSRLIGAGNGNTIIKAGVAMDCMLTVANCGNFSIQSLTIDGDAKANKGVYLETYLGLGQIPTDGGQFSGVEFRQAIDANVLISTNSTTNPQVNNMLFQSCKFYSSKTNLFLGSSNALRNSVQNCSFSDFLATTDWHIYIALGEVTDINSEYLQAGEYDVYRGPGAFFHSYNHYSESQRGLYSELHDPNHYPIDIYGWHQNVFNTTNSVMVFNQNGPVQLSSCLFGGDVYLNNNTTNTNYQVVNADNCKFFTGGFIGPGVSNLNVRISGTNTFIAPFKISQDGSDLFQFTTSGFFMGLNQSWYDNGTYSVMQSYAIPWRWYNNRDGIAAMDLTTNGTLSIPGTFSVPSVYSIYDNGTGVVYQNESGRKWVWYDALHTANSMVLTNGELTVSGQLNAAYVHPNNLTVSTLPQTDGTGNLVSIANAAGALINDGAGAFSYQNGITQTSSWTDGGATNWTMVITKGLITSLTHTP